MAEHVFVLGEDLCLGRRLRLGPLLRTSDTSQSTDQEQLVTKETQRRECQHTDKSDWLESPGQVQIQDWGMIPEIPK